MNVPEPCNKALRTKDLPEGDKIMEKSNIKVVKWDAQTISQTSGAPTQEIAETVRDWVVEIRQKREAEMETSKDELFPPPLQTRQWGAGLNF